MTHEPARPAEPVAPAAPASRSLLEPVPDAVGLIAGTALGSSRLAPPGLMGLQGLAGNAAVAGLMLQRTVTVQRDPVTNDAEFQAAVGRGDWAPAVAYLATLPLGAIEKLASPLKLGECEGLLGHVSNTQHSVRGALLERGFALTKGTDWVKAARFVSVLDDAGIAKNIAPLKPPELKLLAKGARNSPGGGDKRLLEAIRGVLKAQPGELFGKVAVTMAPTSGVDTGWSMSPNQPYSCLVNITFTPDVDVVDATQIAFVQTMSLVRTGTLDSEENRKGVDERFNSKKQAVDRDRGFKSGWYGQLNDGSYKKTALSGVEPGYVINGAMHPATMTDNPEGKIADTTWSYETSVIAKAGPDTGLIYAVISWFFVVDKKLKIIDKKFTVADRPTADFGTAVGAWNKQSSGSSPSPKGQENLPVFRSIDTGASTTSSARPGSSAPPASAYAPLQRCGGEVHEGCACADDGPQVQRDGPFGEARKGFQDAITKATLDSIQAAPMYDLLPKLLAQPADVRNDEKAGMASGGPRLVTAMRAVAAKGQPWENFITANNARLAGLPPDQIGDIITFLGGPKDFRYFKADQIKDKTFGGKFDGSVDPAAGVVTLYFRVRFDMDGVKWGGALPGTPDWEREATAGRAKFEADFKRIVESTWSFKGKVKPACAIGKIPAFATKVVVTVVDSGEHTLFKVFSAGSDGRSNAKPGEGALKTGDTEEGTSKSQVVDPTGKKPEQVTTTQAPAAHEFGHALGLHHPRCPGGDDVCYGVTAEERRDIMGAGNMLQVIRRGGKVVHDDFGPFEAIAKTWGDEKLTGELAKCNTWSAV